MLMVLAACGRVKDPDCEAAALALSDAAYRTTLKAAVQRQFDAGELGAIHGFGGPGDMPGTYAVALAPEFVALTSRPLQQRILFDARGDIEAVFVGWPPGHGVLIDVQPDNALPADLDYGDGVSLVCKGMR
ncbi:hypothetical protein [Luteimonas deserti]|uniref:Uncharacterized protein n=1 Tax=Luteimonas deserti TaxID=2752306 RepID=A0A7Z0QR55_9GAMM|nr:hypothetical protein [Luteimonas deserti]NYZ63193.1 hypothetical protein [Luteimonas deserti]